MLSFILAIAAPELSKFAQWGLLDSQDDITKRFRYALLTRIKPYYLLFSDPITLPKMGASISMGKGNRMTLLLSVAMLANVCK